MTNYSCLGKDRIIFFPVFSQIDFQQADVIAALLEQVKSSWCSLSASSFHFNSYVVKKLFCALHALSGIQFLCYKLLENPLQSEKNL